jgi:uncharacterized protein YdaU (DUF1376 family)
MSKPYMPLMMGDWLRGTRGMRAEVRGVYINLLIHQYDHGYLPSDMETLSLIDPEVGKVWVLLKEKFLEVAPGKLQNKKLEEVRSFWEKQGNNGKKGGRPKKENPKHNPDKNPNGNPKHNHHNDLDLDNDSKKNNKESEKDFTKPDVEGDEIFFPIDTEEMRNLWAAWKRFRWANFTLVYGVFGEQAALKQLERLNFYQARDTIEKAMAGKWKNLYPEQNGQGKGNNDSKSRIDEIIETRFGSG